MTLSEKESNDLQEMLHFCEKKFGDYAQNDVIVCESGCTQCSGGCDGHGMSVWTACDVK